MAKYHINDKGEPGQCHAEKNCPFGDFDKDHFDSPEAARAAYEERQNGAFGEESLNSPSVKYVNTENSPGHMDNTGVFIPDRKFHEVETMKAARTLQNGDFYVHPKLGRIQVKETSRGYKNITIKGTAEGDKDVTKTISLNEKINAVELEETEESKKAFKAASMESFYRGRLAHVSKCRGQVLRNLSERAEKGHSLTGSDIAKLVKADAKDSIVSDFEKIVEEHKAQANSNPFSGVENHYVSSARAEYVEKLKKEIIAEAGRGNDGSSSAAVNLHNREILAAKSEFVNDPFFLDSSYD